LICPHWRITSQIAPPLSACPPTCSRSRHHAQLRTSAKGGPPAPTGSLRQRAAAPGDSETTVVMQKNAARRPKPQGRPMRGRYGDVHFDIEDAAHRRAEFA